MAPMRELGIEEAHQKLEDATLCSRRFEEAEHVAPRLIRLLTSAATIVVRTAV